MVHKNKIFLYYHFADNDIPPSTLFVALSKYLCISKIPTSDNLSKWPDYCSDLEEKKKFQPEPTTILYTFHHKKFKINPDKSK